MKYERFSKEHPRYTYQPNANKESLESKLPSIHVWWAWVILWCWLITLHQDLIYKVTLSFIIRKTLPVHRPFSLHEIFFNSNVTVKGIHKYTIILEKKYMDFILSLTILIKVMRMEGAQLGETLSAPPAPYHTHLWNTRRTKYPNKQVRKIIWGMNSQ